MTTVVVGAGLAGLVAARRLTASARPVIVLDKGRSPGGRLATRRLDTDHGIARLDHGAQFFTVRQATFADMVADGLNRQWLRTWCHGFGESDGHPRYVAVDGMNAWAKQLANGLDVRCNTRVSSLHLSADHRSWTVTIDSGEPLRADAIIVTAPVPQACELLASAGVSPPDAFSHLEYDPTLALLMALDRPGRVPPPGGVQYPSDDVAFVGDNQAKGVSEYPAITLHTSPGWSVAHWNDEPAVLENALHQLAKPWLGEAQVVASEVKRWRYATPRSVWPEPCWVADHLPAPLVLAGDAFAGPRVEGAALSGWAAAGALLHL